MKAKALSIRDKRLAAFVRLVGIIRKRGVPIYLFAVPVLKDKP